MGPPGTYAARQRFLASYYGMAAVSEGLGGVLSAPVELHPHQLRVVRRVLRDPFQRYLLADEVGLGKTIEAGLIIRQRFLDAPRSLITISCPASLVSQWREEMDEKIGIRSFRPGGATIEAFDEAKKPFEPIDVPDLLVIDEAHRIAAGWRSGDSQAESLFERAAALTTRTPRVLLLSATPVLHHERTLLAMLHLLDPDTYKLDEEAQFVKRMREREKIAGIFSRIDEAAPTFILKQAVQEIGDAISDDPKLTDLVGDVWTALENDAIGITEELEALRSHITETYRVHSRVLRNRRQQVGDDGYRVRGRSGVTLVDTGDDGREEVEGWLSQVRSALVDEAADDPARLDVAARFFYLFLERASGDLDALFALGRAILTRRKAEFRAAGCNSRDVAVLRSMWPSEDIAGLVRDLDRIQDELSRAQANRWMRTLWKAISEASAEFPDASNAPKVVVFATSAVTCQKLATYLGDRLKSDDVALLVEGMSSEDRSEASLRFRSSSKCRFLVGDRSAEEGLNLQNADLVAMVDFPVDTIRIEQRLGRVDRRSDRPPVKSVALAPEEGGLLALWLKALRDGFGVFEEYIAPIQFAVDRVESAFLRDLFLAGDSEATRDVKALADASSDRTRANRPRRCFGRTRRLTNTRKGTHRTLRSLRNEL